MGRIIGVLLMGGSFVFMFKVALTSPVNWMYMLIGVVVAIVGKTIFVNAD